MSGSRLLTTSHGTNRAAFTGTDWAIFLTLVFVWGSSFLFIDIGLDHFHPGLVTFLRTAFGAATVTLVPLARRTPIEAADRGRILLLGIIWIAGPLTLFPLAQVWINSAVAGMLNGAMPVFTALVATLLLRELPRRRQGLGLVIGLAGIAAISIPSADGGATAALGVGLVLLATVLYAISTNLVAPLQQRYGALPVLAGVLRVAVVAVAPFGIFGLARSSFAWSALGATLFIGVLGTGLAFVLMGTLSGRVGPTRASFITYLMPVVALVLGIVFRGDRVAPLAVAGAGLVIAGALLASRREI